jgi:poly-gamma-glutamate capsule biosynthesis protein CapA/YwtB (metallophosphatase superfamily)
MDTKNISHYLLLLAILVLLSIQSSLAQPDSTSHLNIVFGGDIMGHDEQIAGAWNDSSKTYDYEPTFRYIKDYISNADIAIGNLEVTLAGEPYKGYPQFSSPVQLALEARDAGFDILATANNHALDRGEKGVLRTIHILDSFKIVHTGTFLDEPQRDSTYPLMVAKNNIKLALLNYTYGTNGLTVDPPYMVNRIDTAQIRQDLVKAKSLNPDYTIVFVHWGIEYERDENTSQQKLAAFIFNNGADIIIGSHPHVVQPFKYIEIKQNDSIKKFPVFFSMGNFVSNQRAQYKDGGIMAELHLSKTGAKTTLDSLAYLPYWVYRKDAEGKMTFYVVPVLKYETHQTDLDFNDDNLYRFNRFVNDTREHMTRTPESKFYFNER